MNILIIGGSSDLGIELAKYYVEQGNNVSVTYFNHICSVPKVESIKCDVRNIKSINDTMEYVIKKYGNIDILINMAAISLDNDFMNKTKEEFMDVLEVNLVGTFLCNQVYSKYINDGIIVNIASTDGIDTGSIYNIDYAASKAGIINMTKSISLATSNKVLCICPNWVDSDSTISMDKEYLDSELKRIGQSRLITIDEFCQGIDRVIKMNSQSGECYRMDIRDDKLWIERV